ncbi:hypothetical protein [Natronobacterium gregoryi]|uniref:MYXO-CTERM domain-containing protein n=2 Tax=Natronobacterium gregoryi TaxID=44930 RepID=L0ALV8_NATGS|nr:hypothetical protein [Natronobacterium gregoryi]AFZ74878.1 hypothetical protein Natgr_3777 [Natronobacterium gregoryi SP2]ELY73296.1 hypothetical protein C490_01777 [Natronobacterium gregoryi SP2]PLK19297.1 hypothetical protein CYV19_15570 [Natronobacterium gregoryi SP2]SFJ53436.1 hypothetical protein SAMN05443661_13712 [Natronobacterium gregoryi]
MPETEQQDKTLSELVVKEAVGKGLDSPLRESILEAVEETEGSPRSSRLPLAGAVFGLGAAVGYLVGQQSGELLERSLDELEEPEVVEEAVERTDGLTEEDGDEDEGELMEMEDEGEEDGSSMLPRILLGLGILAGAVILRRRLSESDEEEWEPIEEFEPATDVGGDEDEAEETDERDAEGEDETEETEG